MKNTLVITGIALLAAAMLPSCKKNYTCTCEVKTKKYIYDYHDRLKGEAEKACTAQDSAAKQADSAGTCNLSKD